MSTFDKVTALMRDLFEDYSGPITPTTAAKDVADWDSLAHVKLMVQVERAFGIRFEAREVSQPQNVGELVAMIDRKLAAKG
jgi:acyl carrier protein